MMRMHRPALLILRSASGPLEDDTVTASLTSNHLERAFTLLDVPRQSLVLAPCTFLSMKRVSAVPHRPQVKFAYGRITESLAQAQAQLRHGKEAGVCMCSFGSFGADDAHREGGYAEVYEAHDAMANRDVVRSTMDTYSYENAEYQMRPSKWRPRSSSAQPKRNCSS